MLAPDYRDFYMPETKEQIRRELYQFLAVDKSVAKQIKTYLLRHDAAESIKETRKENNTLKMELVDKLQKARSKAKQGIAAKDPNSASYQHQLIAIEWLLKWAMEWKYKSEQQG
jgi:hypothetical protein